MQTQVKPTINGSNDHRDTRWTPHSLRQMGQPHCPDCLEEVRPQAAEEITDKVFELAAEQRVDVLAPPPQTFYLFQEVKQACQKARLLTSTQVNPLTV